MNTKIKKIIILNLPCFVFGLMSTKVCKAWRLSEGYEISDKFLNFSDSFSKVFQSPLPSFNIKDLMFGISIAVILRFVIYVKSKNSKKYRKGIEYGSARWGNSTDIEPFIDPVFQNNIILTQTERLMMSNRPKNPKYARNKNVIIVGGSGSGKTRFWLKPNLMQCHSSYVVTDPNGNLQ